MSPDRHRVVSFCELSWESIEDRESLCRALCCVWRWGLRAIKMAEADSDAIMDSLAEWTDQTRAGIRLSRQIRGALPTYLHETLKIGSVEEAEEMGASGLISAILACDIYDSYQLL